MCALVAHRYLGKEIGDGYIASFSGMYEQGERSRAHASGAVADGGYGKLYGSQPRLTETGRSMSINHDAVGFETNETIHEVDGVSDQMVRRTRSGTRIRCLPRPGRPPRSGGVRRRPAPPTFPTTFRDEEGRAAARQGGFRFSKIATGIRVARCPGRSSRATSPAVRRQGVDIYTKEGKSGAMDHWS